MTTAPTPAVEQNNPKWTVMVFMGADTVDGNAPMFDAADDDLKEMAEVGSGGSLNIFAQVHGKGVPVRHHIGKMTEDVPEPDRNPAKGHALKRFISWSFEQSPPRPGDYSMLVLWGHAYEFAIGHAKRQDGTIDALDFAELSAVLARLQEEASTWYGAAPGLNLDILGFDACDLATVEMACQLRPFAKYLLGSQIGIPIPGWPYQRVLKRLRNPIGRIMGPSEFGSYVVRRFCESYAATSPVSLTLLDLQRVPELFAHAEVLALALAMSVGRDADARERISALFSRSQTDEDKPYVDVPDLCLNLVRESGDLLVMEAARALGDFLLTPQSTVPGQSATGAARSFVVEHGRNAGLTAKLNGISLYAPHVAPINDAESTRRVYEDLVFAQETRWSGLVHALAKVG